MSDILGFAGVVLTAILTWAVARGKLRLDAKPLKRTGSTNSKKNTTSSQTASTKKYSRAARPKPTHGQQEWHSSKRLISSA